MRGRRMQLVLYLLVNAFADGLDVGIGIAFADNKKIGGRIAEPAKVQLNNIFAFFIADTFNDEVIEFFEKRLFYFYPPGCCQIQDEQSENE